MFKQTTVAFLFDILALIAGILIAYQLDVFKLSNWALALYPALISTRIINGLLSGRLSTALHLGTINPRFSSNTKTFHSLVRAIIVLTLVTSVTVSGISLLVGYTFWGITTTDFPAIITVLVSTLAIGLLYSIITIKVAFMSFKRGLDPDIVVYPIISAGAIIFITLCYIAMLRVFFFLSFVGRFTIAAICLAQVILVLYILAKERAKPEPEFIKTLRESLLMLLFVAVIVTFTGTIFRGFAKFAEQKIVAIYPALVTIYIALINNVSNVGSVIGSTANTKLALGLLKPSFSSLKNHAKNITTAWLAAFVISLILAAISLTINQVYSLPNIAGFVAIILVSNFLAILGIIIVSYGIAILTFRRGLNPENFVIPLVTSIAAIITSSALLLALIALG
jgi:mgtE-like transporter